MAIVTTDSKHYTNIAAAIRENAGVGTTYAPEEMPGGVKEVYDKGYSDGNTNGYNTGKTDGYTEGETAGKAAGRAEVEAENAAVLEDINTALEGKGAESADSLSGVPEKIESIEAGSGDSGIDLSKYMFAPPDFSNASFPEGTELTMNFEHLSLESSNNSVRGFGFYSNTTGLVRLNVISPESTSGLYLSTSFNGSKLEVLDLSKAAKRIYGLASTFLHCNTIREIIGELDFTPCTIMNGYEFYNCYALEELRIKAGTLSLSMAIAQSPELSAESRQSLVDGYADMTGKTAPTLKVHPTIFAKFTDEQKATLSAKNVNLAS